MILKICNKKKEKEVNIPSIFHRLCPVGLLTNNGLERLGFRYKKK